VIGFDWLLVFLQSHIHQSTVILAMSILLRLLQQPTLLQCFRDGSSASGWLTDAECVIQNRVGVLLGKTSVTRLCTENIFVLMKRFAKKLLIHSLLSVYL